MMTTGDAAVGGEEEEGKEELSLSLLFFRLWEFKKRLSHDVES